MYNCWLVDSIADVHMCNNLRLMTDLIERPMRIGDSTTNKVSPEYRIVWIKLALEDGSKGLVLNLQNIYYFSNSPSNLVSLSLLNNADIYPQ